MTDPARAANQSGGPLRTEEVFRRFSKWWRRALRELLGWRHSEIEAWLNKQYLCCTVSLMYLHHGAINILCYTLLPVREKLEAQGINVVDMRNAISLAIKIGMHGEGDAWLDPSNVDWEAARRRVNNVLALVGESLPKRTSAE